MDGCIFCKIAAGDIPADIMYQDDEFVAFRDIDPQAPLHGVLVPRAHVATLADLADEGLAGRYLQAAAKAARAMGVEASGYRVVVNYGLDGGQLVMHVHMHILGGRALGWPPG